MKTPQKIYASFCEMKPIVLKKPTPPIVFRIIYASKAFKKQGADAVVFEFPSHDIPYYKALAEVRRKFDKRIFFYFKDEQVLKEIKK